MAALAHLTHRTQSQVPRQITINPESCIRGQHRNPSAYRTQGRESPLLDERNEIDFKNNVEFRSKGLVIRFGTDRPPGFGNHRASRVLRRQGLYAAPIQYRQLRGPIYHGKPWRIAEVDFVVSPIRRANRQPDDMGRPAADCRGSQCRGRSHRTADPIGTGNNSDGGMPCRPIPCSQAS
jgi:hypothetical protein